MSLREKKSQVRWQGRQALVGTQCVHRGTCGYQGDTWLAEGPGLAGPAQGETQPSPGHQLLLKAGAPQGNLAGNRLSGSVQSSPARTRALSPELWTLPFPAVSRRLGAVAAPAPSWGAL